MESNALIKTYSWVRSQLVLEGSRVDALSELWKVGNSTFIAAIASGLFPKSRYRSLE